MRIRKFDLEKDYFILENWVKERNWPKLTKDILTEYGFLVYNDEKELAVAWLYPIKGCKTCMIGFPFSNPNVSKEIRKKALDKLFDHLHKEAKNMKYNMIMTFSSVPPVMKRVENMGYIKGDENVNQYFGRL